MFTSGAPGAVIEITPAHAQLHLLVLFSDGILRTSTVGQPGTQGVVTGIHGMGVSTPSAADVAAATVGFASELHMPNGGMFAIGAKSMMLAAGILSALTVGLRTISDEGAAPKVHCIEALIAT